MLIVYQATIGTMAAAIMCYCLDTFKEAGCRIGISKNLVVLECCEHSIRNHTFVEMPNHSERCFRIFENLEGN